MPNGHDEDLRCDFCNQFPVWVYPCADFTIMARSETEEAEWNSAGGWIACDPCSAFIEADDRVGLAVRAISTLPPDAKEPGARAVIEAAHHAFFANRSGPRQRWATN